MFREAVVGVNFGSGGDAAIALAGRLVAGDGHMTLVNVVPTDPTVSRGDRDSMLVAERARSLSLLVRERELVRLDRRGRPGPRIDTCALAAASPARGLEAVAGHRRPDLVVVGASRRTGLGRYLLGDDTSATLGRVTCAVAVAPRGYAGLTALDRARGGPASQPGSGGGGVIIRWAVIGGAVPGSSGGRHMRPRPRMNPRQLRDCVNDSFGPRPTQGRGLAFHLTAYCWPGGAHDRSDPLRGDDRLWSEQAVLPLPECTCRSGCCRLCN